MSIVGDDVTRSNGSFDILEDLNKLGSYAFDCASSEVIWKENRCDRIKRACEAIWGCYEKCQPTFSSKDISRVIKHTLRHSVQQHIPDGLELLKVSLCFAEIMIILHPGIHH